MKKGMLLVLGALLILSCTDVDPGYVNVRVWKRGANAGEMEILSTGRHTWSVRASDRLFPVFKQNYVWTKDSAEGSPNDESFSFTIEGLVNSIDVGIEFSVIPDQVGTIYSEYRQDLDGITDGPMRNFVRDAVMDAASVYTNMEEFISNNSINQMMDVVEVETQAYFATKGISVSQVYLVGAPRYPSSIVHSIEQKIEATQRAIQRENELREAEASAAMDIAEANGEAEAMLARARAQAEADTLRTTALTPEILQSMWIEKWDGHLPEVTSDADGFMLNLQ